MQQWQRRLLGVLALGGSFTGLVIGVVLLISPGSIFAKVLAVPFLVLYVWGIFCGLRIIEGFAGALRSNLIFWAIQIPYLTSPIAGYIFASGAVLNVKYAPAIAHWSLDARLGSEFNYSILQSDKPLVIGVNIFALAVCGYLAYLMHKAPSNNSFKPNPLRGSA